MNFTHIRNKVKMLLTEQKMLILEFVSHFLYNIYSFTHLKDVFLQYLQYVQGLGTFVQFFSCLLGKRRCC